MPTRPQEADPADPDDRRQPERLARHRRQLLRRLRGPDVLQRPGRDTSYGLKHLCRYIAGLQRVDIAGVQAWLATYGVTAEQTR